MQSADQIKPLCQSDTPRCDKESVCKRGESAAGMSVVQEYFVRTEFARTLERESVCFQGQVDIRNKRIGILERENNGLRKQNETLTRTMRSNGVDAAVDGGEFTYNDWMQIRQKLLVETNQLRAEVERLKAIIDTVNRDQVDVLKTSLKTAREALEKIASCFGQQESDAIVKFDGCGTESFEDSNWTYAAAIKPICQIAKQAALQLGGKEA